MSVSEAQNLAGLCDLKLGEGQTVEEIKLVLEGRLESFRAKRLNQKNAIWAHEKLKKMQERWLLGMYALDAVPWIIRLQRECALAGVCIEVVATAKRKITIRDHKDLEAAVDHQILDALVRSGVLINDDTGNLVIGEMLCEPVETYLLGGRECLILIFRRSGRPCRDSITERVIKTGWPPMPLPLSKNK